MLLAAAQICFLGPRPKHKRWRASTCTHAQTHSLIYATAPDNGCAITERLPSCKHLSFDQRQGLFGENDKQNKLLRLHLKLTHLMSHSFMEFWDTRQLLGPCTAGCVASAIFVPFVLIRQIHSRARSDRVLLLQPPQAVINCF